MALAFQQHLMHNNHNGTHIVMQWKTWKQKTSLSALKAPRPWACFRSRSASHRTIRTIPARFGCAKRRRFGAAILPRRFGSERLGATSPGGKSEPLILLFSWQFWNRQKDVFVARVWQSIFDLGAYLKQILEQCVRLSCVSSQETSMRFRRVGLQRDKNDKKNPSEKSVTHQKTKSSWAPLHLLEMCRISRWIFFSRIVDQENQEGDDATNAEILNLNKGKQKNRLEHVVCGFARKKNVFLQIVQQSNNI